MIDDSKQTQSCDCGFRLADWGKTSGRPPAPMPATGRLRQTNPIPAGGKEEASAWRERGYGESYSLWASAKQSQFGEARLQSGESIMQNKANWHDGSRGPIVRNKPNFRRYRPGRAWAAVQTNPIPGARPIRRSAFPGGQIVPNKPNSGSGREEASALRKSRYGESYSL